MRWPTAALTSRSPGARWRGSSPTPLPCYREWRAQRGVSPWKAEAARAGVVWYDDGEMIEALTRERPLSQRGKGRPVAGKTPLAALSDWLRQGSDGGVVAAIGFAVGPRDGP